MAKSGNPRRAQITVPLEAPLEHGQNAIRISVTYDEGGPNYFSGGVTRRGYYVSTGAQEVRADGSTVERLNLGGGGIGRGFFIAPTQRFQFPKLEALAEWVRAHKVEIAAETVARNNGAVNVLLDGARREVFGLTAEQVA
jgi:hypothetical protein